MPEKLKTKKQDDEKQRSLEKRVVSARFDSGELLEVIYQPDRKRTCFLVSSGGLEREVDSLEEGGHRYLPYRAENNLLTHKVVLLPSGVEEYESQEKLEGEIRQFIHRYVDLSPDFLALSTEYVILSWLYDHFGDLPYLRVRGDYGSGKSRFLQVVGSLCYMPIFASGASSVSSLFRIMDIFRGTLIVDEADFRASDEKAEVIKILNNGNARGFPVLRTEQSSSGEFNPRAFQVFGPKLIATRGLFQDRALESRCLSEEMGGRVRKDIPLNLPKSFDQEALVLRNKLLLFRFRMAEWEPELGGLLPAEVEPRISQILSPLISIVVSAETRTQMASLAQRLSRMVRSERSDGIEWRLLGVISGMREKGEELRIGAITSAFTQRYGIDYDRAISPRFLGGIIRRRLGLIPERRRGVFVLATSCFGQVDALLKRYEVAEDIGDVEDIDRGEGGDTSV